MNVSKYSAWAFLGLGFVAVAGLNVFVYQQRVKMDAMIRDLPKVDTTTVQVAKTEPEFNPISFAQALALLEDPQDQISLTDLQKTQRGAGVLGKKVQWTGYVMNVTPAYDSSRDEEGATIILRPDMQSPDFAQAVMPKSFDLSSLNKGDRVSVDCVVKRLSLSTTYIMYCDAYSLGGNN